MRIVVVEDEAPIREGMAKILSKINTDYKVVGTAVDGEKGAGIDTEGTAGSCYYGYPYASHDGIRNAFTIATRAK